MKSLIAAVSAAMLLAIAPAAHAGDDDDNAFVLVNKSTVDAIQFYTKRKDGSWSNDWLKLPVKPGATRPLKFFAGDERCEVQTRVVFADASEFNSPVDYCGVTNLIVTDDKMFTQ
ncbi:hypothetical protein C100_02490 [Sphingobium sp. C100]|jgi:hypothetical protein|uniref:hypothetical protein n=1 Tax=Sphingobium sp. C100 TaxID=1207055 RepID=UPI0003D5989C|nr:hypothetical protein [Sphingobium sp. C100]ETI65354.1 hypothetical protein C100_02490 [Sphingobium sp. C100]PHQ62725.1 MAG: hypothetical protein COC10_09980 [Sphingobium sp.]